MKKITKKSFLILAVLSVLAPVIGFSAQVDPYSYRHDTYIMPPQNQIQEKALLKYELNLELPKLSSGQPAVVVDADGNKSFYAGGKIRGTLAKDGTLTHYIDGIKRYSEKILLEGGVKIFKIYKRVAENIVKTVNEFGDSISWEVLGFNDKVIEKFDAYHDLTFKLKYDGGWWEKDTVNKKWKRTAYGLPTEERLGEQSGEVIGRWHKGSHYGKEGFWKIEKEWDGEKADYMYYGLYNSTGTQDREKYHESGYVLEQRDWSRGMVLDESLTEHGYRKYGDFGWSDEGAIAYGDHIVHWNAEYDGSKIVRAKRFYQDIFFYDERLYDANGNVDIVLRKDVKTDEVLGVLEDRIYFRDVENMTTSDLKEYFKVSREGAEQMFKWVTEMKMKDKSRASLFGILHDMDARKLTVYEEYNRPLFSISLLGDFMEFLL